MKILILLSSSIIVAEIRYRPINYNTVSSYKMMFGTQLLPRVRFVAGIGARIGIAGPSSSIRTFGGRSERVAFAMGKLARSLEREGIDYCVIGGNALHAHGFERATIDVDVLLTKEGLEQFVQTHVGRGYVPRFVGARQKFRNTADDVPIDIVVTGDFPGDQQTEVPFPDPSEIAYDEGFFSLGSQLTIRMVDLKNLITLKLLSYQDLPEERAQDYIDVRKLIEINLLDDDYAEQLHPSVRNTFRKAVALVARIKAREKNEV